MKTGDKPNLELEEKVKDFKVLVLSHNYSSAREELHRLEISGEEIKHYLSQNYGWMLKAISPRGI